MRVKLHRCSTRWKVGPCWRVREASRFVVFFRNRPQAVLLHVDEYERLVREAEQVPVPARS